MKLAIIIAHKAYNWQSECISRIANMKNMDITLIQLANMQGSFGRKGLSGRLYSFYEKIDNRFFSVEPVALGEADSMSFSSDRIGTLGVHYEDGRLYDADTPLKDLNFDLIINLTSMNLISDGLLNESGIGTIEMQFGFERRTSSCPPGFWEVKDAADEMGIIVYLSRSGEEPRKLYEGSSIVNYKSVSRTNNVYFWKIPGIIVREVEKFYINDGKLDDWERSTLSPGSRSNSVLDFPSSLQVIGFLWNMMFRIANRAISGRMNLQQWILLLSSRKGNTLDKDFKSFKRIVPPKDRYWADPFLYAKNNKNYIFLEEVHYSNEKGIISVMELDEEGEYELPEKILEEDFHLSYPFLIENGDDLYMIPESSEKREIRMYKCLEFPHKWKFEKTLMKDVIAVDTTIVYYEGLYWMFTNIASHEATSTYDELYLFFAEDLLSEKWISHPGNPIVTDVKNARPAGNLFIENGKLYRPSQNCSINYGYGMQINHITKLSKTEYQEATVASIYPDWDKDLVATHTINMNNELSVIDALIRRRIK